MTNSEDKKYRSRGTRLGVLLGAGLLPFVVFALWMMAGKTPPITSLEPGMPEDASRMASARLTLDNSASTSSIPPVLQPLMAIMESNQRVLDAVEQTKRIENEIQKIAVADIAGAVTFLNKQSSSETNCELKLRFIRRWAELDPRSAADWVNQTLMDLERHETISAVVITWANQNLQEAAAWVRLLPQDEERNSGLINVAYEAARTQPIEALRIGLELPEGEYRDDLIAHTASEWAATDSTAAAAWANQITDGPLHDRVLAGIVAIWGESDPVAAASMALNSLTPGKPQEDAIVGVVQRWAQNDPEAVAAWVAKFPRGLLMDTSVEELVRLWADQNLETTGNWLKGLERGTMRDVGVMTFVDKLAPGYPEIAKAWAEDIGDATIRLRQMEAIGEAWIGRDAAAARAWITRAELPEAIKTRLLAVKPN